MLLSYLANAICTNLLVLLIHPDSFSKMQIFHQSLLVHAVYPVHKVKVIELNTTYNKTSERKCLIVISYSAQKITASYMSKTLLPPSPVGWSESKFLWYLLTLQASLVIYAILLARDLKIYTTFRICDHFRFNAIWHIWSMLEASGSDISVTLSVTCTDWIHWWHNHAADAVLPLSVLDFVNKMSEKHKFTSPIAIRLKNWCKTISQYWRVITCGELTGKRWMNCWHIHS